MLKRSDSPPTLYLTTPQEVTPIYQMWITANSGRERFRFPVLPLQINVRQGMNNQSVNIQGLGELVIMQDPAAMGISFSSYFPTLPSQVTAYDNLIPPHSTVNRITAWMRSDRPIQFLITGTSINRHFTIEDFPWHEVGGDVGTIHFSLVLKEYRATTVRQVQVEIPKPTPAEPNPAPVAVVPKPIPVRVDNRESERTHTVVSGDTLYAIARTHLGQGSRWREIYQLNQDIIRNPNLIFPGQVLRLPAGSSPVPAPTRTPSGGGDGGSPMPGHEAENTR